MEIKLTPRLERDYGHIDWKPVTIGRSNAKVYQNDDLILKMQTKNNQESLSNEKLKMDWLKDKTSVPDVVDYDTDEINEYLIVNRVHGKDAAQTKWLNDPIRLVTQLGYALRHLHDTIDITKCPFDMRPTAEIYSYAKKATKEEVAELFSTAPEEDLVFTHGDYCLPNIIIDEELGHVVGFIDLGRAGIADRYHDLALCLRSIKYNTDGDYRQAFLDAYGLFTAWDDNKISFFQKLEDLF